MNIFSSRDEGIVRFVIVKLEGGGGDKLKFSCNSKLSMFYMLCAASFGLSGVKIFSLNHQCL